MIVLQAAKELIDSEKQDIDEIESTTHDGAHGTFLASFISYLLGSFSTLI